MTLSLRSASLSVLDRLVSEYGTGVVTRADLVGAVDSGVIDRIPQWLTSTPELRVDRGVYRLPVELLGDSSKPTSKPTSKPKKTVEKKAAAPVAEQSVAVVEAKSELQSILAVSADRSFVPKKSENYISWGNSKSLKPVLESGRFLPVFITGLSGNGKTFMIEQEVARLGRELFRVNINTATDEDDLIGGFRLIAGETVWFDGPVVEAMKRGAVLLLDELDLGTEKILCLQSVLEGKGIFIKKTNQWIIPAPGFTVIATGNTKGQGDDTNKFIGANVMNEAFLERFPVWLEQTYPTNSAEQRILKKLAESIQCDLSDTDIEILVSFADKTRKTYAELACDDLISTRRLCLIVELVPIFGSVSKAVEIACSRFCDDSKRSFIKLYSSLVVEVTAKEAGGIEDVTPPAA